MGQMTVNGSPVFRAHRASPSHSSSQTRPHDSAPSSLPLLVQSFFLSPSARAFLPPGCCTCCWELFKPHDQFWPPGHSATQMSSMVSPIPCPPVLVPSQPSPRSAPYCTVPSVWRGLPASDRPLQLGWMSDGGPMLARPWLGEQLVGTRLPSGLEFALPRAKPVLWLAAVAGGLAAWPRGHIKTSSFAVFPPDK